MKKILFTGEQGNLARTIIQKLDGDKYLSAVTPKQNTVRNVSGHHPWPELDILSPGLTRNIELLEPDLVVHSAAVVNTDKCLKNPETSINVNFHGTRYVLEACKELKIPIMYFSTTATYDPNAEQPYKEHSFQRPKTLYGITKYAGELLITQQDAVPWTVIRPCFIFGDPPFDHSSQICRVGVHSLMKFLKIPGTGPTPLVTLNPNSYKDYMRVEDFSTAIIQIIKLYDTHGMILNVSLGHPRPVQGYFNVLESALGCQLDLSWDPEADYMGNHVVNSDLLKSVIDWSPEIDPYIGVLKTAQAIKKYLTDVSQGKAPLLYK